MVKDAFLCSFPYLVAWVRPHDRHAVVTFSQKHPQCVQFALREHREETKLVLTYIYLHIVHQLEL